MAPRVTAAVAGTLLVAGGWWAFSPSQNATPPAEVDVHVGAVQSPTVAAKRSIEELFASAEQHDQASRSARAVELYAQVEAEFALADDPGRYLQSVLRQGLFDHATKETERAETRFTRVIELYEQVDSPLPMATDAAAQAQFMLAEQAGLTMVEHQLGTDDEDRLKNSLQTKQQAGQRSQKLLEKVITYDRPRWSIAAYVRMATLYREFAASIRTSAMPDHLSATERENYRAVLDQSAKGVERNALESLRKAVTLSEDTGIATADTSAARLAIAQLEATGVGEPPKPSPTAEEQQVAPQPRGQLPLLVAPAKLTRSDVKGTIVGVTHEIAACASEEGPWGTVKVKFYITPSGQTRGAKVVGSAHEKSAQGECVRRVVEQLEFPQTSAQNDVPVTYPFILRRP